MLKIMTFFATFAVAMPALANPARVKSMIEHGGPVVVSCAPMTCTEAEEARLQDIAAKLHAETGGRVVLVTAPPGLRAEPYAEVGDQVALGKKDVLLARSETGWAARAPGLAPGQVEDLVRIAAGGGDVEAGLTAVARQLPQALAAQAAVTANLPPPPSAAPAKPAADEAPDSAEDSAEAATPKQEPEGSSAALWLAAAAAGLAAAWAGWRVARRK